MPTALTPALGLALGLLLADGVQAQEAPPVVLAGTHQHDLVSAVNGQPYRLYVGLPEGYAEGS